MSSFPPPRWQVRYLKDLDTLRGTVREDIPISMEALLAIQPSSGEEGNFRFTLAGPQHLQMRFEATSIINHDSLKGMWISLQMELGTQVKQLTLLNNTIYCNMQHNNGIKQRYNH